jgi:hypothetical protein
VKRDAELARSENAGEANPVSMRDSRLVRRPLVGAESAGYVVYHAVIITWLLVGVFGIAKLACGGAVAFSCSPSLREARWFERDAASSPSVCGLPLEIDEQLAISLEANVIEKAEPPTAAKELRLCVET